MMQVLLHQIHWSDHTTPIAETMEAVALLMNQGKVRYAGVCNYTADKMAAAERLVRLASNQLPYSMIRRDIEQETVPYCIRHKKGFLAYSPLQRGLLTGKFIPSHAFNDGDSRAGERYFMRENILRVNAFLGMLKPLANEKSISLTQLVIGWTLQQPGITAALVGARNPEQVLHKAKGADVTITKEDLEFIDSRLAELELL